MPLPVQAHHISSTYRATIVVQHHTEHQGARASLVEPEFYHPRPARVQELSGVHIRH